MRITDKVTALEHQLGVVSKKMDHSFLDVEKQLEVVCKRQSALEGEVVTIKEDQRHIRQVTESLTDHFKLLDHTLTKAMDAMEKQGKTDYMRKTIITVVITAVLLLLFLR
jgi:hypothetical protein